MTRVNRWHQLAAASMAVPRSRSAKEAYADCVALLDHVLELFPRDLDPVEDQPGHAVRALASALRARLVDLALERGIHARGL